MWFALFIIVIVIGVYVKFKDDKWHEERGIKRNQDKPRKEYHFDEYDDEAYVTRAQRRRQQEKKKKEESARRKWLDDYDTFVDENGNEHSLDYDNYCDECDEYHEE